MSGIIGHQVVVHYSWTALRWYPEGPGPKHSSDAKPFNGTTKAHIIVHDKDLETIKAMVEQLMSEDYGNPGVHEGVGVHWTFEINKVIWKRRVRLSRSLVGTK